ncbi:MAG: hypothetical protein EMLJLAPB_00332 [Candidatus Argoarchaeum ethanivorans]|uniref:Fibronectin type-III domain-containing protein n=1 Tax=Candidatus Argoarchaeum ethanivorans TaxID=2608793 RepID=A0A811TCZ1_9EURY|nr:MAG: hypothetical protein EMLJLAPB_00332 [Candidatus Argoarchaeum ethanivorans]
MHNKIPIVIVVVLTASILLVSSSVYANDATSSTTVLNAAPAMAIELAPDDNPVALGVQVINPNWETQNRTVMITATVTDMNGWDDIVNTSVTATVTGPSVVEDSPVSLSFDSVVNVTTATYTGSFNMSTHTEGDYKVVVTATDVGGLTAAGSKNFTYLYSTPVVTITVAPESAFDSMGNDVTTKVLNPDSEYAVLTVRKGTEAYVGMNFVADIPDSAIIESVTFYYEHHESSTLDSIFIEVYDNDTAEWVRYSGTTSGTDTLDSQDVTMQINTSTEAGNNRIRYVCYESGGKTEKGYLDHGYLNITYSYVPDTTPPAKVTGVTVTPVSCAQLDVSWTANNESDLAHYNVYQNENLVASPTTSSYSDTGLTANTTYYYKITAVDNACNEGTPSDEKSGTTATDTIGPVTSDMVAEPNPTNGAETVTLTATISDSSTCNSIIAAAEYFVNATGDNGNGTAMSASDGAFNAVTEAVTADINVSGWSAGDYTLYVHGKDEAGNWGGASPVVLEVTEESVNVMHVHSINMSVSKRTAGKNTFTHATAVVTIVNATNSPVEGAAVYGTWSNATSDSDSGITNSAGQVSLDSDELKNAPSETTFTFTVDDVSKAGWTYDPAANVETNDSITVGTYDFSTGAGSDKWAYRYQCNANPPSISDVPDDEFKIKQYKGIKIDDDTMQGDASSANGFYAIHRFKFDIEEPESSITKLDILWDGAGFRRYGTHGAMLYIWNFEAGKYEQLDRKTDTYITLEGTIATNIGNYIDDGTMIITAEQNSPQVRLLWWTFRSRLGTDYVKVEVTHTPQPNVVILDVTPGAAAVHPGDSITFAVDIRNDGAPAYGYAGGAARYPDGTYCNTEWEKTNYLDTGDTATVDIDWTVPADAPAGSYGFVSATWDGCWTGCEGTPCYLDGCCDGEQDRYEEANLFEVVS